MNEATFEPNASPAPPQLCLRLPRSFICRILPSREQAGAHLRSGMTFPQPVKHIRQHLVTPCCAAVPGGCLRSDRLPASIGFRGGSPSRWRQAAAREWRRGTARPAARAGEISAQFSASCCTEATMTRPRRHAETGQLRRGAAQQAAAASQERYTPLHSVASALVVFRLATGLRPETGQQHGCTPVSGSTCNACLPACLPLVPHTKLLVLQSKLSRACCSFRLAT